MTEILATLALLSVLVFVIGSMGLSLKMPQIIAPLKDAKLVILALVANFVLVPIVAILITLIIPLDESVRVGLILLATAAGAPFLPKLAEAAKGSTAFSVGLMVLLMVAGCTVSTDLKRYQEENHCVLPYRGVEHDMGSTCTHKVEVIRLLEHGYVETDIRRKLKIKHSLSSIERYVQPYKKCHQTPGKKLHTGGDLLYTEHASAPAGTIHRDHP